MNEYTVNDQQWDSEIVQLSEDLKNLGYTIIKVYLKKDHYFPSVEISVCYKDTLISDIVSCGFPTFTLKEFNYVSEGLIRDVSYQIDVG